MSRNQFSDMTPRKRSIRDIPIPHKQNPASFDAQNKPERIEIDNTPDVEEKYFSNVEDTRPAGKSKKWWFIIILLIAGGFWGASVFLHAATVNLTPERAEYTGATEITAKTDASPAELQYDSLQFVEDATRKVPATAEEDASIKASGRVIVYNNYSTAPQKLIANTRFESAAGKIYRIQDAVTVPGFKTVDGKKVPGSVEATIYADQGGEAYNSTKTDFKIPGFKGTAQYEGFYARSTTDITGGFIGKQKKVDPKLLASTTEALRAEIEAKIAQSIVGKIPSDFIYLPGGSTVQYVTKPIGADGDQAVITVEGNVRAFVFKKEGVDEVLKQSVSGMSAEKVMAHDYSMLAISNAKESEDSKTLEATLSGNATVFAVIDKDVLSKELAGTKKSLIGEIVGKHSEIVELQIFVRPPWMFNLPSNPERIHIIEKIDE